MKKENPAREKARNLARLIVNMSENERAELAARAPILNIEGRPLSGKNHMLMALQCPAAVMVAGFRQWLAMGRNVTKGQTACYIWAPSMRRAAAPDEGAPAGDSDAAAGDSVRFVLIPVFDVSQTEETTAQQAAAA